MSYQEGFSGAFVEAISLGKPFVSTDVGGAKELSCNGKFGKIITSDEEAVEAIIGFCGALLAFILSFIPPSQISTGSNTVWFSVLVIGCIVVVGAPFLIYAARKPSWRNPQAQFEPFHWEQAAQTPANIAAANAAGTNAAAKPADGRK